MKTGADVVACAQTWLRTPFAHAQINKGHGVDCAGLIIGVARELSLVAPDFKVPAYRQTPDGSMLDLCDRHMIKLDDMEVARAGDVLVVAIAHDPQHLAILCDYKLGGFGIIHAARSSDGRGAVIQTRLAFSPILQFVAVYRLPGVA